MKQKKYFMEQKIMINKGVLKDDTEKELAQISSGPTCSIYKGSTVTSAFLSAFL